MASKDTPLENLPQTWLQKIHPWKIFLKPSFKRYTFGKSSSNLVPNERVDFVKREGVEMCVCVGGGGGGGGGGGEVLSSPTKKGESNRLTP